MKKLIIAAVLMCGSLWGQGSGVNQTLGPPPSNWVSLYFCGTGMTACGSGNLNVSAICYAPAFTTLPTVYSVAASTLTNIIVATNVGTVTFAATAQVWVGQIIVVTGSATSALNASYRVSAVSGSTATITTSGVPDATYTDAALKVSTNEPVLNASVWSIQIFTYINSSVTAGYFAGTPQPSIPQGLACSNRANY